MIVNVLLLLLFHSSWHSILLSMCKGCVGSMCRVPWLCVSLCVGSIGIVPIPPYTPARMDLLGINWYCPHPHPPYLPKCHLLDLDWYYPDSPTT